MFIIGSGGHAISLYETVTASGHAVTAFVDPDSDRHSLLGHPVMDDLPQRGDVQAVVAFGDNYRRESAVQAMLAARPATVFPALIHPSAAVAATAEVGRGSVVMQGAVVGACVRIGEFCIVSTRAAVAHESTLADFSAVLMGAVVAGGVTLGPRAVVSMGTSVRNGVRIGRDSVVGASSYVSADVGEEVVVFGVPAQIVRPRTPGERYL